MTHVADYADHLHPIALRAVANALARDLGLAPEEFREGLVDHHDLGCGDLAVAIFESAAGFQRHPHGLQVTGHCDDLKHHRIGVLGAELAAAFDAEEIAGMSIQRNNGRRRRRPGARNRAQSIHQAVVKGQPLLRLRNLRWSQPQGERHHVLRAERGGFVHDPGEGLQHEARCGEQHQSERDLADHQGAERRAFGASQGGARRFLEPVARVHAGRLQGGSETEHYGSGAGQRGAEQHEARVQVEANPLGQVVGHQRGEAN